MDGNRHKHIYKYGSKLLPYLKENISLYSELQNIVNESERQVRKAFIDDYKLTNSDKRQVLKTFENELEKHLIKMNPLISCVYIVKDNCDVKVKVGFNLWKKVYEDEDEDEERIFCFNLDDFEELHFFYQKVKSVRANHEDSTIRMLRRNCYDIYLQEVSKKVFEVSEIILKNVSKCINDYIAENGDVGYIYLMSYKRYEGLYLCSINNIYSESIIERYMGTLIDVQRAFLMGLTYKDKKVSIKKWRECAEKNNLKKW